MFVQIKSASAMNSWNINGLQFLKLLGLKLCCCCSSAQFVSHPLSGRLLTALLHNSFIVDQFIQFFCGKSLCDMLPAGVLESNEILN